MKNVIHNDELILQLQAGDHAALSVLMRNHYQGLYDYGCRFCSCKDTVKDAIQEVFISLWQKRSAAGGIASIRYYLLGAVRNQVLKSLRRDGRVADVEANLQQVGFEVDYSIEEKLIRREVAEQRTMQLRRVLAQLSPRQKEALYLRYYQDMDALQIAALMQLSPQSVYNLLHEAIRKLRIGWDSSLLLRAV